MPSFVLAQLLDLAGGRASASSSTDCPPQKIVVYHAEHKLRVDPVLVHELGQDIPVGFCHVHRLLVYLLHELYVQLVVLLLIQLQV